MHHASQKLIGRYWRPEIQRFAFAYRAVTGVDLIREADPCIPGFHMRRRYLACRE